MSGAPDFLEPVVGYRAWRLRGDGELRPFSLAGADPWRPGVNRARCEFASFVGKRRAQRRHRAPAPTCMCGIYALHDHRDERLDFDDQAVGAIAAWGEMEVHRTGFRAEYACVIALADDPRMPARERTRLRRAAERYGVAVVPFDELEAEALRHAAPLPPSALPDLTHHRPGDGGRGAIRATRKIDARGWWPDGHLWVRPDRGELTLGITRQLAALLPAEPDVTPVPDGADLAAGEAVAVLGAGLGALVLCVPFAGRLLRLNPQLASDPSLLRSDPEGAGWLARLEPAAWPPPEDDLLWGRAGRLAYEAGLADALHGIDVFGALRPATRLRPTEGGTWADVMSRLRAAAAAPRYTDADDVAQRLVTPVAARLAADPALGARLAALGVRVAWRLELPAAAFALLPREGTAEFVPAADTAAEVTFTLSGATAERWFLGLLDPALAIRSGRIGVTGDRATALAVVSLLTPLYPPTAERRLPRARVT